MILEGEVFFFFFEIFKYQASVLHVIRFLKDDLTNKFSDLSRSDKDSLFALIISNYLITGFLSV